MWQITDDNGKYYEGTQAQIQLIWDLIFREPMDLANEYRQKYSQMEILQMKRKYQNIEWSGKLNLIEIHESRQRNTPHLYR